MRFIHRLLRLGLVSIVVLGVMGLPMFAHARERLEGKPFVIGHRGASGYLPEHTLESYALAIDLGADFVEPDLVMTRDGHLIARHEPNLIATTDVKDRPEFAGRKRTAVVDGFAEEGWFASDFTLAEIKTLRAVQAFGERLQQFNGQFQIPTLEEVIQLVKRKGSEKGRFIGIYPETKHPTYHRSIGLPLEPKLVQVIRRAGWDHRTSPAAPFDRPYDWTVSGDPQPQARLFSFFTTDAGFREIKTYADGIGPWKRYIVSTAAVDLRPVGTVKSRLARARQALRRRLHEYER